MACSIITCKKVGEMEYFCTDPHCWENSRLSFFSNEPFLKSYKICKNIHKSIGTVHKISSKWKMMYDTTHQLKQWACPIYQNQWEIWEKTYLPDYARIFTQIGANLKLEKANCAFLIPSNIVWLSLGGGGGGTLIKVVTVFRAFWKLNWEIALDNNSISHHTQLERRTTVALWPG